MALRFFSETNGDFVAVVPDPRSRRIVCVRDRFGTKPLFYSVLPDGSDGSRLLLFASEPRALFASGLLRRRLSEAAAFEYVGNGMGRGWSFGTMYERVQELPGGHALLAGPEGVTVQRWYDLKPQDRLNETDLLAALKELFLDAIRIRLPCADDLFTPVSGGLDSNSVLGAIAAMRNAGEISANLHCVHLIVPGSQNDESGIARQVAASKNCCYHEFPLPAVVPSRRFVEYLLTVQAPVDALQHINQQFFYAAAVRAGAGVLLAGEYGDTFTAGLAKHYLPLLVSAAREWRPLDLLRLVAGIRRNACRPVKTLWSQGINEASLRHRRMTARQAIKPYWRLAEIPDCVAWGGNVGLCGWIEYCRRTMSGWRLWDATELEAVGAACGLEWRTPFLDHRMVELLVGQDPFLLLRDGWSKYTLRRQAERWLPDSVCWEKAKRGLYVDEDQVFPDLRSLSLRLASQSDVIRKCLDVDRLRTDSTRIPTEVAWRCLNVAVLELDREALAGLPNGV